MQENPYEVSSLYQASSEARNMGSVPKDSRWYVVDGSDIICHRILRLPEVCIFTGESSDLVAEWRGVRPKIYLPWNWRKARCLVHFHVERRRLQKYRRMNRTLEGLSFGMLILAAIGIMLSREVERHAVTLGLFIFPAFVILQLAAYKLRNPLRYVSREGDFFRIGGFGPPVIQRLLELQGADL